MPRRRRVVPPLAVVLLLLGLAALPAGRGPRAAAPENLLLNPSFEELLPGHPWMPAAWDTFESGLNTVFFGRDSFLVHDGRFAVNVANLSSEMQMFHNWSQTRVIGRELWNKDVTLSVWTRSNGIDGRGYILAQAYRDTIRKMAIAWKIPRDSAAVRMNYTPLGQPIVLMGWRRRFFSDPETDWVRRTVRIYVPAGANILIVRCGLLGTGQVYFDDAQLTASPPVTPPPAPTGKNLLVDGGFEADGNDWDYSLPPFPGLKIDRDTVVVHDGHASLHCHGGAAPFEARGGVCQVFDARPFWGKRLRLSGWVRTDSMTSLAYIKLYAETADGPLDSPASRQFGRTSPWTQTSTEMDVPPGDRKSTRLNSSHRL